MRAVIQRVKEAGVRVSEESVSRIPRGLCVFVGVEEGDAQSDVDYIASKLLGLRVFEDDSGKMNLSVVQAAEAGAELLLVAQFTLLGDARKGRRPSFDRAESPGKALALYRELATKLACGGVSVKEGVFKAHMQVDIVNDGPVTILLDSRTAF